MVTDGPEVNAEITSNTAFMNLLPDTPAKYLGKYDEENILDTKGIALRNHLMQRRNYQAIVSGDGACAGCGEKSVLRAVASMTEAYMRPIYHEKADRFVALADHLESEGKMLLSTLAKNDEAAHGRFRKAVGHLIMGFGGEDEADTEKRLGQADLGDEKLVEALVAVLRQEAFNHRDLQAVDGRLDNGMSVMAMSAHTGCNTVFGSTPPNNPHPYPWMNSLFQDGATVGWLFGESFIRDHARRSVIPERLATALLGGETISEDDYYDLAHFTDGLMTEREISELPKVWAVGGDGGMGDIGFQNVSKVVLQNRPNVKLLMLDTQVYSNTGGQNSDSSPAPGGADMNRIGKATQGKTTEKKNLSEIFITGHGSPYVAQVSMANSGKLYGTIANMLAYRGTAFLQAFTTCQPEHGVGDDVSALQAKRVRDSRGMPEFVFDPSAGEVYSEAIDLKGNPSPKTDWWTARYQANKEEYLYTTAHWAASEARFRGHFKVVKPEACEGKIHLVDMLKLVTQRDLVERHHLDEEHRAYIPDFGVWMAAEDNSGKIITMLLSRQMVTFCVERRKAWRLLQSKAGIDNPDYKEQRSLLNDLESGKITRDDVLAGSREEEASGEPAAVAKKKADEAAG